MHREVCVQYPTGTDLPAPSPLVNHHKMPATASARGRRKVIYGGAVGTSGATPRQRENPPSQHPFFGRQEASEREARGMAGKYPSAKANVPSARKLRQQQHQEEEQKQQREAPPATDEDSACPSPPTMQRLSFAGGGAGRSRAGSSSGRGRTRRSMSGGSSSTTPPGTKQPRQGARGAVAAAVKKAASRVRRSTYTLPNGLRSRGSLSPRRPPTPDAGGPPSGPVRRESAPLYPVALEKSRRAALSAAASGIVSRSGKRGPPPPYASVAHRADTVKKPSSHSTSPESRGWVKSSSAGSAAERGKAPRTFGQVTDATEAVVSRPPVPRRRASSGAGRSPPPLPPRSLVYLGSSSTSSSSPQAPLSSETPTRSPEPSPEQKAAEEEAVGEEPPMAAEDAVKPEVQEERPLESVEMTPAHGGGDEGVDGLRVSKDGEDESTLARETEEEDTEEPTPERKDEDAQEQDAFGVPEEILPRSLVKENDEEPVVGPEAQREDATVRARSSLLAKDAAGGVSQDSAAGSTVGEREKEEATVRARSFLSSDSAESISQDSAAGSTVAESEDKTIRGRSFLSQESVGGSSQTSAAGSTADREDGAIRLRPALANDSGGSSSQESGPGSSAEREKDAVPGPPTLAKGSPAGSSHDSAACSAIGQEDSSAFRAWPTEASASTAWPTEDDACTAWPTEDGACRTWPTLKGGDDQVSLDSAAASTFGEGAELKGDTDPVGVSPATGFPDITLPRDSTMGSTAGQESNALPSPLSMEPPAPIVQSTASANAGASVLSRAPNSSGAFDSCPPSAGGPSISGPQRSLSVGTAPQYHSMPLVAAAKGVAAAAAAAWNVNRRNSPRPRPPVSPGPAALSQSFPVKPSFRLRKHSAVDPEDEGAAGVLRSSGFSLAAAAAAAAAAGAGAPFGGRKMSAPALSRTTSARSFSTTTSGRASPVLSSVASPRSPPFVPAVELSPRRERPESPPPPGPRPTDTATFYRERSGAAPPPADGVGPLPPPSRAYLGRPEGFCVHVLVASADSSADLPSKKGVGSVVGATGDEQPPRGEGKNRRLYYSMEDRERVASALQPGDVVLVTPGRYEAGAWGLQHLISSVEIIGAGKASDCVLYNKPAPATSRSGPAAGDHYLVGVMGGALGNAGVVGASVPEVKGKDSVEDDSDSGFEEGAFGVAPSSIVCSSRRAVRVRLANLTLEQGSGYRGAVHQLGRESHLEMDGCTVLCSQGGVNVDQGTCVIHDSTISGSEAFGVHIGGEGAVEHCSIFDCGQGGGRRGVKAAPAPLLSVDDDDGTDVNRVGGMPAISVLQSSRVRVRYNVIRDNAGHALQCRDSPLPGGDGKYAVLARRAEAEAAEVRVCIARGCVLLVSACC